MAEKDIRIKVKTEEGWNVINPITTASNVYLTNQMNLEENNNLIIDKLYSKDAINDAMLTSINNIEQTTNNMNVVINTILEEIKKIKLKEQTLKTTLNFINTNPGYAHGEIRIEAINEEQIGLYKIYWADNNGILEDYKPIAETELENATSSKTNDFIKTNFIPNNATRIIIKKDEIVVSTLNIAIEKRFKEEKICSIGLLSDTHVNGIIEEDISKSIKDITTAFTTFNEHNVDAICISGDVTHDGRNEDIIKYNELVTEHAKLIPVYTCRGNHDFCTMEKYTSELEKNGLYYEKIIKGEIFLFLGLNTTNYDNNAFSEESIIWLETKLEEYKNRRIFVIEHVFINPVGNPANLYPWRGFHNLIPGGTSERFVNCMKKYKNVVFINGHSHLEFNLQRLSDIANCSPRTEELCHSIHVPSCSRPRGNSIDTPDTFENIYNDHEASEGYILDIYPNNIILKGRDFITNKAIPTAQYIIDTTPIIINDTIIESLTNSFSSWEIGSIEPTTGINSTSEVSYRSDFIAIEDLTKYTLIFEKNANWIRFVFYNESKQFISCPPQTTTPTVENEEVIIPIDLTAKFFKIKFGANSNLPQDTVKIIKSLVLTKTLIEPESPIVTTNVTTWSPGSIEKTDGSNSESPSSYRSDFIEIQNNKEYTLIFPEGAKWIRFIEYDIDKNFISYLTQVDETTVDGTTIKIPTTVNTKFIRVKITSHDSIATNTKIIAKNIKLDIQRLPGTYSTFNRSIMIDDINDNTKLKVIECILPDGIVKRGRDNITAKLKVESIIAGTYEVNTVLTSIKRAKKILNNTVFTIEAGETKTIDIVIENLKTNEIDFYDTYLNIEKQGESMSICSYYSEKAINIVSEDLLYLYTDDLESLERDVIGTVGSFRKENVTYEYKEDAEKDYSSITILNPKETKATGQIMSKKQITYGSFESRFKVPNSDSILNGFFLFGHNPENPDASYEIDIEILYKDNKWQLWTTIHNSEHELHGTDITLEDGEVFQKKIILDFDPSLDYHNYKIDFYKNYVSFKLDEKEISRWDNTFVYYDMRVYVGNFYTHWLAQNVTNINKTMEVEWIRKNFIE